MKKILFPTEFSAHASQSFLYALDLAKQHKASVTLLHAYHVPLNPAKSFNEIGTEVLLTLQDFADENTPKEYASVKVNCIAEMGFAADAVLKVADDEEMDFIVMSMKGKTNALEAYFGSVSLDIVNRTDLPVLLIPTTNRFKKIEKIAFAFNLSMENLIILKQIDQLIGKLKANTTCVHFHKEEEEWLQLDETLEFLEEVFQYHPKYKSISFSTISGEFKKEIHEYIAESDIDLLITQSHQQNWKFRFVEPSSSNKIARKINIPMLILKEQKIF